MPPEPTNDWIWYGPSFVPGISVIGGADYTRIMEKQLYRGNDSESAGQFHLFCHLQHFADAVPVAGRAGDSQ
jgi:hypothetical protein